MIIGNSVDVPDQDINIGDSIESGRTLYPVDASHSGSCAKLWREESGVNSTLQSGSCAKFRREESGVNGALHFGCPQESTFVMDGPIDGGPCVRDG